jgi:hypothetical protein
MKTHKRRSRIVAGLALVAASAAVASAMFGPATAGTAPIELHSHPAASAALDLQLPVAVAPHHSGGKHAGHGPHGGSQTATTAASQPVGVIAATRVADTMASVPAGGSTSASWWLDYAGTASRTRGQPRTDALT